MNMQIGTIQTTNVCSLLIEKARRVFNDALLRGNLLMAVNGLLGRRSGLKALPGFSGFRGAYSRGLVTIPIRRIVGSENRCHDYDRHFHPLNERTRVRWSNIAISILNGRELPPVELIEVDGYYYIRDGHHRISALSAFGQVEIEALVTVWER
ncbi:hypothetical protein FDZ74_09560 [bacterium]|nr:MAG: hypothetical protein FDZ74_09560 [bacterium]